MILEGYVEGRAKISNWTCVTLTWRDLATGILVLGLPQLPLTLGSAIIATAEKNNTHFADRPTRSGPLPWIMRP